MKTARLFVNPTAGRGRAAQRAGELESELERVGIAASIVATTPARDGSLAGALAGVELAIAVGGDGTLNRVADAVLRVEGRRPTLGFLPCGTGNAASRAFRLPRRARALAALAAADSGRRIDVGIVRRDGAQVALFLLWAGIGVDASLIETIAQRRAAYRGWRLTAEYVPVHADGEPIGALPVEVTMVPSAIRLLAPAPRS